MKNKHGARGGTPHSNLLGGVEAPEAVLPAFGYYIIRGFTQIGEYAEQTERKGKRYEKYDIRLLIIILLKLD